MKKLLLLFVLIVSLSCKPPSLEGTWLPLDPDKQALREELTFTPDTLTWKTGFDHVQSVYKYELMNESIIIYHANGYWVIPVKISGSIMRFGNHRYRYKIPYSK